VTKNLLFSIEILKKKSLNSYDAAQNDQHKGKQKTKIRKQNRNGNLWRALLEFLE